MAKKTLLPTPILEPPAIQPASRAEPPPSPVAPVQAAPPSSPAPPPPAPPTNGRFRSESNASRYERALSIFRELYHFAETSRLFGEVGISVNFQDGNAQVTKKVLQGTEK